jgi:hypothetical protein
VQQPQAARRDLDAVTPQPVVMAPPKASTSAAYAAATFA